MTKLFAYLITGNTSYLCNVITSDQIDEYPAPHWYISDVPIIWSGEGAKRMTEVFGVLEDVPVIEPEPPVIIPLTKAQKLTALNAEYNPQILSLNTQITIAVSATKNTASEASLRTSMTALQAEYNTKRMEILNG